MTDPAHGHYGQAAAEWQGAMQSLAEATVEGDDVSFQAAVEVASLNLMSASLHASLAQVDAIRELTAAVREFRRGA